MEELRDIVWRLQSGESSVLKTGARAFSDVERDYLKSHGVWTTYEQALSSSRGHMGRVTHAPAGKFTRYWTSIRKIPSYTYTED